MDSSKVSFTSYSLMFSKYFIPYFSLCGFGNPISFKHVDDKQISIVESFIKHNISLEPHQNKEDYFGKIFANNPTNFEILPGERIFIKDLLEHVKAKMTALTKVIIISMSNKTLTKVAPTEGLLYRRMVLSIICQT